MSLIDKISSLSESYELESFLSKNSQAVHDYFNRDYADLLKSKRKIRDYVLRNQTLRNLDLSNPANVAYLEILLKYCERFSLSSAFSLLLTLLNKANANIGNRLEAAAIFITDLKVYQDFLDNYDNIVEKLKIASLNEEDDNLSVVVTFVNYYNKVIRDCSTKTEIVDNLRAKITETIANGTHIFLNHALVKNVLLVDYHDPARAVSEIQEFLEKSLCGIPDKSTPNENELLIEENTQYTAQLEKAEKTFDQIREISITEYAKVQNADNVFYSLNRGVSVLQDEAQMYSYMVGLGNMHKVKMDSAFEHLPLSFFENSIELYDWACGQGIATMVYLNLVKERRITQQIKRVTLIEPSEVCIKRAAAHISALNNAVKIRTINKPFDDLIAYDILPLSSRVKLHLFSNILDVELFNLSNLVNLISETQKGLNYFACVSPSITELKNDRVESFVRYFRDNYQTFEILADEHNSPNGEYWNCNYHYNNNQLHYHHGKFGCNKKWKRILKVFAVKI